MKPFHATCLLFGLISNQFALSSELDLEPSPSIEILGVVGFQLVALQSYPQEGSIEAVFRFASPANRKHTGPLKRFGDMLRQPTYDPMLGHFSAKITYVVEDGDSAMVVAVVTDKSNNDFTYTFNLSRQSSGLFQGSWMTDGVVLIEHTSSEI